MKRHFSTHGRSACALTLMLLVFSGFGHSQEQAGKVEFSGPQGQKANVVVSPNLLEDVKVPDVKFRKLGELTQAQITVQNVSKSRYTMEYKINWLDKDGFESGTLNSWHRFVMTPGELQTFQSTGQVPAARDIVFILRLPDDYFIDYNRQFEKQNKSNQLESSGAENRGNLAK